MTNSNLAQVAAQYGIDTADIIDRQALALRLTQAGMAITQAARICGVGRQYLHARIRAEKSKVPA